MGRAVQLLAIIGLASVLVSCGGSGNTYSPSSNGTGAPVPDWQFQLGTQLTDKKGSVVVPATTKPKKPLGNVPVLTDLGTVTPGQVVTPVNVLAVALNGFTGNITLADVASATPDHIPAVPSVATIAPTAAGAPFNISITIPANYPYAGTGVEFQGTDANGKVKQELITFKVSTVSGSFTPVSFVTTAGSGSGPLSITGINGFSGPVAVTFDTNLTGAPTGFSPLPGTVQVTAPSSPVTISGTTAITTPIQFTWSAWSPGSYEVIAVLTNGKMAIRVPVQITITTGSGSGGGSGNAVVTWHNDNMRTGQNPNETTLTTLNVGSTTFGRLYTQAIDARTMGQPLYVPNLSVNGGTHNVVYVATANDSVYAFDADNATGPNAAPLWHTSVGTPVPSGGPEGGNEVPDGILSTPVIDVNTHTLFVCAKNWDGDSVTLKLHALDLTTGNEVAGGPVTISGTVSGVTLQPANSYQRPALLLLNGVVYVGVGGQFGDPPPDRGWIFGYSESNLQNQTTVFTTTPDVKGSASAGGSIWQSSAGLASDGTFIYATTGNGDFNANVDGNDYGDSILKLQPSGSTLNIAGFFTPFNQLTLSQSDLDLGSSGPLLIPGQSSPLLLQVSKTNEVYIANTNSMGGFNAGSDNIYQEIAIGANKEYLCAPAYYNNSIYMARGNNLAGFSLSGGILSGSAFAAAPTTFGGAYLPTPSVSFNGNLSGIGQTATAIVWAIENASGTAVLHAYAASNLSELYTSNNGRDTAGTFVKWAPPMIANGKVYVPCGNKLAVYGEGSFGQSGVVKPRR